MFAKILIANRGEIAVRVARTCRDMGILSVAVYSTVDSRALHVQMADEAYEIGPAPALESYLNMDAILRVARESGAEAVHPGYGFLAENAEFARKVMNSGLVWIGPPPEAIELMGDKVASKQQAYAASVPSVPGYAGQDSSLERLQAAAEEIGYPIMIKAAAGGGGKGMRSVHSPGEFAGAVAGARREAGSAFGDDRIFLEKLLQNPRHVEVQIVADTCGACVSLGERDCSIQRRHQKIIEESPSPAVSQDIRGRMAADAVRLARSCGYVGAGTVEFLFADGAYYFLEMNTRIQVEHPVTEMVTGLDLVRLQIEIAAGEPLPISQLANGPDGVSIEARIYAEDACSNFMPSTGTLTVFEPPQGPGIRNDEGVYPGAEVSPYYDPMLGKLVVWGPSRGKAVDRLVDALSRYRIDGVTSNLPFLRWLVRQPAFREGRTDTGFLDRFWSPERLAEIPNEVLLAAAAFDAAAGTVWPVTMSPAVPGRSDPWRQTTGWRANGGARSLVYMHEGVRHTVEASHIAGSTWNFASSGATYRMDVQTAEQGSLVLRDGTRILRFQVRPHAEGLAVAWAGANFSIERAALSASVLATDDGSVHGEALSTPMPGTVVVVSVEKGQRVTAGQPLVVIEAMKTEHVIHAPHDGVVESVLVSAGDMVPAGSPVITLES